MNIIKMIKMTEIALAICSLLLIYPVLAIADSNTNLVANPGFESGISIPMNWTFINQDGNAPIWDNVSYSGSKSIKISTSGMMDQISGYPQSDLIPAESLTNYTVSIWGKTENAGGTNTPAVRVVELDANEKWLGQTNLPVFGRGTNDWEPRTLEFQTGSNTAYIYIYANIWNGYGTLWMDDVELRLKDTSIPVPAVTPVPTVTPAPVVTATPTATSGSTIAYLGDARPSKFGNAGIKELTKDFNNVVSQSPNGKVDAIFLIGDFDTIPQTQKAFAASTAKNIPIFYVIGNHEVSTSGDVAAIKAMKPKLAVSRGPTGTDKTTYSVDIGGMHVVNMDEYWDGKNNDAYGDGYVPDALYDWISKDLSGTTKYKILLGHEPMYPKSRHVGDSLDADKANRDKLQALLVSKSVKIFIGAHTHYATVNTVGGVYHVDAGVSGQKTGDGEDPFASFIYTHIDNNGKLVLTWKHDNSNSWSNPTVKTYTIN